MNTNTSTKPVKAMSRTTSSAKMAYRTRREKQKKKSLMDKRLGAEISKTAPDEFSLRFEEAVDQLKDMVKVATDFVQRRPIIVLASAAAAGLLGAWALSKNRK